MTDTDAVFLSWVRSHRRSSDLADLLGAEAVFIQRGRPGRPWTAPARHLLQAALTVRLLRRRRPDLVYVMAPPALAPVAARLALGRRSRVVVDAHGKAVRRIGSDRIRLSFRLLARLADAVLVTNEHEAARVRAVTEHVHVLHDPIPPEEPANPPAAGRPAVVFPASWEVDEPLDAVVTAARLVPGADWLITGRARRELRDVPPNLRCTGWLSDREYAELLAGASVVLALTTRDDTMQRAGYDAAALGIPLVASDTAALRSFFGDAAAYTEPTGEAIATAVWTAIDDGDDRRVAMRSLADRYRRDQDRVAEELVARLSKSSPPAGSR